MDPISAIFVMAVLSGLVVKGVDVATDGLLSAEVGAGVRGAGAYGVRAGRARWRLARTKAREIRQRTPQGRAVQELLDLSGLFARVLFGEARRFGSGVRTGWETARDQARSARTERRGDAAWPVTVRAREWAERVRTGLAERGERARTATPNEPEPNGSETETKGLDDPNDPNEDWRLRSLDIGHQCADHDDVPCPECGHCRWRHHGKQGCDWGWTGISEPCHCMKEQDDDFAADPNGDPNVPNDGCLHVTAWRTEAGERWPRYCGELREPGWVLCPTHLAARRADPDYPQEDIDEFRADPDHLGPDAFRSIPDPNGDPNVPNDTHLPDANGDVKCGCCAQLHKPLEPGEHCPNCHIHDHAPTTPNAPTTKGPSMDITSAPAAIAAAETFRGSFESLQSRADTLAAEWDTLKNDADTLHGEFATLMDGMGDFAIGGEADTAASVGELSDSTTSAKEQADNVVTSISTAKEAVDAYIDNLHLEYDGPIEAAAGKAADVHSVMQEA